MSEKKDNFISNLRAIIISCKGGLPLANVQSDYAEAFGESLPFKALGYKSLKHFFEENKSDFQISGDKVHAVVKCASSHISSLVQRQKGVKIKRTGNVRKQLNSVKKIHPNGGGSFHSNINKKSVRDSIPPRLIKESNDRNVPKTGKDHQRHQGKTVSFEKVTLRSPHGSKVSNQISELARPSTLTLNTSKRIPSLMENLQPEPNHNASFSRTASKEMTNNHIIVPVAEPFGNVQDYPLGKGVQGRVLKQKFKMSSEYSDPVNQKSHAASSTDVKVPFDLTSNNLWNHDSSVNSLTSPNSAQSPNSPSPVQDIGPTAGSRQKAQARIANMRVSLQKNIIEQEVNNNTIDGTGVTTPVGTAKISNCGEINENQFISLNQSSNNKTPISIDGNTSVFKDTEMEYVKKLSDLCKQRNIPDPYYKIIVREPKNEPRQYICKVQMEEHLQLSSYPIETRDPYAAKEIAAKKMYNYLVSDESYCQAPKIDKSKIISRVLEIVTPKYGVWSDKLPILYKEKYNEPIAKDWLDIIMKAAEFEIDRFGGNRFIIRKKTEVTVSNLESVQSPKSTGIVPQKLVELELPESDYWELYITNIRNSDEIWCRLIGENYSDTYDAMMTKLELEPLERKAKTPKVDGIYGIKVCAIWYRVKLIEMLGDGQALVFYIDVGDRETVSLTDLYEPEDIYFSVAPQAILISLHELESFSDDEEVTGVITKNLLGNTYVAEIISVAPDVGNDELSRATVRLWDTSTERDINVNQLLLNNIIKTITFPTLPSTAKIEEVFVSSVNENGDVYIQTNKMSVHHLKCLIFNKIKSFEADRMMPRKAKFTIGTDILHLTKRKLADIYCRTKVIEIHGSSTVDVQFVDYGCIERIPISDLIHLEKSSILQAIPAQALKVKLANVTNFSQTIISKLRDAVLDQNVLMKVISSARGTVPSVEFFKRSIPDNTLYSVNAKLNSDPELKISESPNRRKSIVVGMEKVLPKNLPPPDLPSFGQLFEVFVTFASSPDLFIVQPLQSRLALMDMMNELQVLYGAVDFSTNSKPNEFVIGELYAVQHPDGNWYRGCVQFVFGSDNYSVYLCDFGDCIMVTREKLKPLPEKYKTFPYQAIRATLSGIPPGQRDWTPVDCITFHQLVVEKYFVSTVIEINRDSRNPNYINLGLILTDTSGEDDVLIHKVLLENKNEAFTFIKSLSIT